ncbi:MAG: hypothetical protein J6T67_08760 [Paludibacteraceae bacterium]|nr:hypothetical protein [Paludibacteraceae bacterium]
MNGLALGRFSRRAGDSPHLWTSLVLRHTVDQDPQPSAPLRFLGKRCVAPQY